MANDNPEDRIRKLKQQAEELAGEPFEAFIDEDCPPEVEEEFWEQVVAYEQAEGRQLCDFLTEKGVALPPPDTLDDGQIAAKLREIIDVMALLGAYLTNTDHLGERDLYAFLWSEGLHEYATLIPENPDFAFVLDLLGSGSEEENRLFLKYYATEDYRREWAEQWPDDVVPNRETPPFDRDRFLPKPDFERDEPPTM